MRNEPQRAQRTQRKKEIKKENLVQPHKEMVLEHELIVKLRRKANFNTFAYCLLPIAY
jgi:hypothetical protein